MRKTMIAIVLGIVPVLAFIFFGERFTARLGPIFSLIVLFVYFFICQFLLSRGYLEAYRKDGAVMLALDVAWIVFMIITLAGKRLSVPWGVGFLLPCFVGTWAGAVAASLGARRRKN